MFMMSSMACANKNPTANVFLMVNLGCEMLFVIDQRLKAQRLAKEKADQGIKRRAKNQISSSQKNRKGFISLQ